jgi:hypothetical protein
MLNFKQALEAVRHSLDLKEAENHEIVDGIREYFNKNNIEYDTFSFEDLKPYLEELQQ